MIGSDPIRERFMSLSPHLSERERRLHAAAEARAAGYGGIGHHLDFEFHLAVATASNNSRFVHAVRMVEHDIDHGVNVVRYLARFDHLKHSQSVIADHSRILRAIRQQRPEEARKAMRSHLENARLRMVESKPPRAAPGSSAGRTKTCQHT